MEQTNTWGGARPGAGRKPKAMRYAPVLNAVEEYFASELMNIAIEMVKRAKENDDNIAKYIMNRMYGAPAHLEDSPATDRMLPYNDANLENAVKRLAEHSPNNSAIDQVIEEILEDTVCTVPPAADIVANPMPVSVGHVRSAEVAYVKGNVVAHAGLDNVNASRVNNEKKSFAQLCAEYNMDPRTVDVIKLRDAIRARHCART